MKRAEETAPTLGPRQRMAGVVYRPDDESRRYAALGVLTQETLIDAFEEIVTRHGDRIAIADLDGAIEYRQLHRITNRIAAGLLGLGLEPLDRVVFQLANSRQLVFAYLACLKAGVIPICTLVAHRRHEISYLARHAAARAHFIDGDAKNFDFLAFSREIRAEVPSLQLAVVARAAKDALSTDEHSLELLGRDLTEAEIGSRLACVPRDPWQVAIFQLSGGTTGVPKIIPRFHNEYLYSIRETIRWHGIDETLVAFTPSPMMHNAPMICYWGPALFAGGEIAVTPGLDEVAISRLMITRKPNWICMPAVVYLRLKSAGVLDELSFDHVKASILPSGLQAIERMTGAPTLVLFGMTEGLICFGHPEDPPEARYGTVGRSVSQYDELRILRPDSEEDCAEGEIGELAIRGPCVIGGYYDAEERNREAFTSDRFYRSGDLCGFRTIGGSRYLTFEGRIKDVVSRGGEKINAMEVETAALAHPKIGSIAIVPMPDPAYEERACAFVVPAAGAEPVTVQELGAFLGAAGMAKFKWPERIEIVTDLPMTSSGKVSKPLLKDIIRRKIERESAERTGEAKR